MKKTIRIGILNDMSAGPPSPSDFAKWLRLAVDELIDNGRIEHDIEFVDAWGLGLPSGTASAVERAYEELMNQNVSMIVGPAIGDNALVATPLAERFRIPTINWAGAERARSEYMFHLQVGSHEEESIVLARYFASLGVNRVGVVFDRSSIGERHLEFLQIEADVLGLEIAIATEIDALAEQAVVQVNRLLDARMDALIYLGLGIAACPLAREINARNWTGPRAMNTAGIRGYAPEFARAFEGWIYVDMHADNNNTLAKLRQRLDIPTSRSLAAAKGYDLGRLVAEGLARAPELTCDGVKAGLERVKWLLAAEGYEGTLLGFGIQDRGALHGRYLVLRQWLNGQSVEV